MLVIRVRLDVLPAMRTDFLDAVTDVVHDSRHLEGVASFEICESVTEPNEFVSVEVYEDEAAWGRHQSSEIFTAALPRIRACLASPMVARVFHVDHAEVVES